MRTLTLPSALLALVAAAPALRGQATGAVSELRLGPGDVVRIEVLPAPSGATVAPQVGAGRTDGAGDYAVDAEGFALLPLLGLVQVASRPFGRVREDIERAYQAEYVNASVRITPLFRVAVIGEVRTPGLLPVDPTMTLADVIAAVGGLTPSADRKAIRLVRGSETLLLAAESDVVSEDIALRSGDRIVVARRSWVAENLPFVMGAGASVLAAVLTALIVR